MKQILLARHGQASFGQDNYDQLSALGGRQAWLLGRYYRQMQQPIDGILTGTLQRQRDSARYFWQGYQGWQHTQLAPSDASLDDAELGLAIHHQVIADFDEFDHQQVFLRAHPEFVDKAVIMRELATAAVPKLRLAQLFDVALRRWHSGEHDSDYTESWQQFSQRAWRAMHASIRELDSLCLGCEADVGQRQSDGSLLVFTSGGVISAIAAQLLAQDSDNLDGIQYDNHISRHAYRINRSLLNSAVTTLSIHEQRPQLLSLNEHSHLRMAATLDEVALDTDHAPPTTQPPTHSERLMTWY